MLFGKMGRPMGKETLATVNAQAESGAATYLFVASPAAMRMNVYRGRVESVTREQPADSDHLIPDYYSRSGLARRIGSWFRLTELEGDRVDTLRQLVNAKSGRPVLSLFAASRTSMFIVEAKPGLQID